MFADVGLSFPLDLSTQMADRRMTRSLTRKVTVSTFVLVFIFTCIACVGTQKVVGQKWVGKNVDQFVLRNGQTTQKFELKSGHIAYIWSSGTAV